MWPSSVVYPPDAQANEASSATATMIPVSQLAREGFTPAAMGMVLCNDANIEAYVNMVQGLHAEGVVRFMTCDRTIGCADHSRHSISPPPAASLSFSSPPSSIRMTPFSDWAWPS